MHPSFTLPWQKTQRSLPFGTTIAAQVLGHRDMKFPESRPLTRRLLYWDHLCDQVSYILCPPDTPDGDAMVDTAGRPLNLPLGMNLDDMAPQEPLPPILKKKFDKPLAENYCSRDVPSRIASIDLDVEDDADEATLYSSLSAHDALAHDFPFSLLDLSSEDSIRDDNLDDLEQLNSLPDGSRKQGVSHIPVTAEEVLQTDGEERFKWMCAGRKELDSLTATGTVECISPEVKERIKAEARTSGNKYAELPSRRAFTIKPDKCKVRTVACGNKTSWIFWMSCYY